MNKLVLLFILSSQTWNFSQEQIFCQAPAEISSAGCMTGVVVGNTQGILGRPQIGMHRKAHLD